MTILYIECGSTNRSSFNTGIQRVVRKIIENKASIEELENVESCILVEYVNNDFYLIDEKKESYVTGIRGFVFLTLKKLFQILKFLFPKFVTNLLKKIYLGIVFVLNFFNHLPESNNLSLVEYQNKHADKKHVLLLLDASWDIRMLDPVGKFKENGGQVCAVQYDLIPFNYPEVVEEHTRNIYTKWWIKAIHHIDGVICISDAVRQDFYAWQMKVKLPGIKKEAVDFFYLGADFLIDDPIVQVTQGDTPFFVIVGSIEPRKNHALVLEAFEMIWEKGVDVNLVICYGNSWMSDNLIKKMMKHSLINKNLFLLNKVSDKDLIWLYQKCTAAIMASYAEGFGLPIIEASQCGANVICNDIPVFREIGGDNVVYFELNNAISLATTIIDSLGDVSLNKKDKENKSWITWLESAKMLAIKTMQITGN